MTTILIWSDQCFFLWLCSFVSYDNALFREIRNIRNWLSHAKASFAKHEISQNKEYFFAKYETRFSWNSREFCTKETRVSTLFGYIICCTILRVSALSVSELWYLFDDILSAVLFWRAYVIYAVQYKTSGAANVWLWGAVHGENNRF